MYKLLKGFISKAGLPPGTMVPARTDTIGPPKVTVIDYSEGFLEVKENVLVEDCLACRDTDTVTWINIDGLHDTGLVGSIGSHFNIHPLVLEDIVHAVQRPKLDDFGEGIFVVLRMLTYDEEKGKIDSEQISVILGKKCVISFQEREGDVFDSLRERIRSAKGRVRKMKADYLAYSLMDAVVDNYFSIIERLSEKMESIEANLLDDPRPEALERLHHLRNDIIFLRKSVWPLREVVNGLERSESQLITKPTKVYLRDLYDHTIQVIDTIESARDMVSGMTDLYLSSVSNKMNEVMKVLTIIATIFIPITFVAGVYGMNFDNMPELHMRYGYLGALGVMGMVSIGMLYYFRRKGWL